MKFISKYAIEIMLAILLLALLYHVCIVTGIVPYKNAWGGKLNSRNEMYVFESISIGLIIFLAIILLIKANYLKPLVSKKAVNVILWIFFVLFLLNTIGNLFAKTNTEKLFSILTLLLSFLMWKVIQTKTTKR